MSERASPTVGTEDMTFTEAVEVMRAGRFTMHNGYVYRMAGSTLQRLTQKGFLEVESIPIKTTTERGWNTYDPADSRAMAELMREVSGALMKMIDRMAMPKTAAGIAQLHWLAGQLAMHLSERTRALNELKQRAQRRSKEVYGHTYETIEADATVWDHVLATLPLEDSPPTLYVKDEE